MNKKGFTLIELLAAIVILGVISSVAVVGMTSYYKNGKEKAEEAFVEQIKGYVDDYLSLYGSGTDFSSSGTDVSKCFTDYTGAKICNDVKLYKSISTKKLNEIEGNIVGKDLINPNSNVKCSNEVISFYRDSDFVYCFTIDTFDGSCLSDKIDTCSSIYEGFN